MMYYSYAELRERMNAMGRRRQPFLWGIDFMCERGFLLDDPYKESDILWNINGKGNYGDAAATPPPSMRILQAISRKEYRDMFATVRHGLLRGDSFLTNLTAPTLISLKGSLKDVFLHSRAPFRLLIGDEFVCFSPEPFVRIKGNMISTFPMKGTADASLPDAEKLLMENYKELSEHFTITDLMRNDLNSIAEDVEVARFRYVERIPTASGEILQTSSEIRGRIPEGREFDFGDIILPLLPAGSITGAPKRATVDLILKAESAPRGWYTGVFGFFDGSEMQSAVMIRCVSRSADGSLHFHSGGGITVNSDADAEYDELIAKVYLTRDKR